MFISRLAKFSSLHLKCLFCFYRSGDSETRNLTALLVSSTTTFRYHHLVIDLSMAFNDLSCLERECNLHGKFAHPTLFFSKHPRISSISYPNNPTKSVGVYIISKTPYSRCKNKPLSTKTYTTTSYVTHQPKIANTSEHFTITSFHHHHHHYITTSSRALATNKVITTAIIPQSQITMFQQITPAN